VTFEGLTILKTKVNWDHNKDVAERRRRIGDRRIPKLHLVPRLTEFGKMLLLCDSKVLRLPIGGYGACHIRHHALLPRVWLRIGMRHGAY